MCGAMKIGDWLLSHYKKRFGDDIVVLDHSTGATWNDGGSWNYTIVQQGDRIFGIKMDSDYASDGLETVNLKAVPTVKYVEV